jgi:hypothetical protein
VHSVHGTTHPLPPLITCTVRLPTSLVLRHTPQQAACTTIVHQCDHETASCILSMITRSATRCRQHPSHQDLRHYASRQQNNSKQASVEMWLWYRMSSAYGTRWQAHAAHAVYSTAPACQQCITGTVQIYSCTHSTCIVLPYPPTQQAHGMPANHTVDAPKKNNFTSISSLCNYLCTHCCVSYRDNSPLWMAPPFDSTQIWARTVKACRQPNHTTWRPDFGHPLHKAIC